VRQEHKEVRWTSAPQEVAHLLVPKACSKEEGGAVLVVHGIGVAPRLHKLLQLLVIALLGRNPPGLSIARNEPRAKAQDTLHRLQWQSHPHAAPPALPSSCVLQGAPELGPVLPYSPYPHPHPPLPLVPVRALCSATGSRGSAHPNVVLNDARGDVLLGLPAVRVLVLPLNEVLGHPVAHAAAQNLSTSPMSSSTSAVVASSTSTSTNADPLEEGEGFFSASVDTCCPSAAATEASLRELDKEQKEGRKEEMEFTYLGKGFSCLQGPRQS